MATVAGIAGEDCGQKATRSGGEIFFRREESFEESVFVLAELVASESWVFFWALKAGVSVA